jgi:hypothetical protein
VPTIVLDCFICTSNLAFRVLSPEQPFTRFHRRNGKGFVTLGLSLLPKPWRCKLPVIPKDGEMMLSEGCGDGPRIGLRGRIRAPTQSLSRHSFWIKTEFLKSWRNYVKSYFLLLNEQRFLMLGIKTMSLECQILGIEL